jgi:hypothetical protein
MVHAKMAQELIEERDSVTAKLPTVANNKLKARKIVGF